jgi:hypothetical protein
LRKNEFSDICNTAYSAKTMCLNSICLVLFVDGATFTISSVAGSIWTVLAIVSSLPSELRIKFENILKILFINGNKQFSFNAIFRNHLTNFKFQSLHSNSTNTANFKLKIESLCLELDVYIHALISDSPARAKVCNTIQFNGKYGCLFCLEKGQSIGKKHIYPYLPNKTRRLRTKALYDYQVVKSATENIYKGIKG